MPVVCFNLILTNFKWFRPPLNPYLNFDNLKKKQSVLNFGAGAQPHVIPISGELTPGKTIIEVEAHVKTFLSTKKG